MKKLLLLFILVPFTVFAEFYPGSVFMENGKELSGFIKEPSDGDEQTLEFKIKEDAQTLNLEINNIKGFEYRDNENENVRYITAYFTSPSILEKVSNKKAWFKVEKEGSLILCSKIDSTNDDTYGGAYDRNTNFDSKVNGSTGGAKVDAPSGYAMAAGSRVNSSTTKYFIKKIKDNSFSYLGPCVGTTNWFVDIKNGVEDFFKDDCPNLADSLNKADLKKNGLGRIVDLYQQNCGAK